MLFPPDPDTVRRVVQNALTEDIGEGDITSQLLIPADARARMCLIAREEMVACGVAIARQAFETVHASMPCFTSRALCKDGQRAATGTALLEVSGNARALLAAERTALNLLQRMCGVATLTAHYTEAVRGTRAVILDTRKTMPGLRELDKYAVRAGGGVNHRMRLDDMVLIKDNHIALCGGVYEAVRRARAAKDFPVVVECDTLAQVAEAVEAKPDRILLDNMSLAMLREAVTITADAVPLEASGGVSLETVRPIAQTGVHYISVGKLTHSAYAVDISADAVLLPV